MKCQEGENGVLRQRPHVPVWTTGEDGTINERYRRGGWEAALEEICAVNNKFHSGHTVSGVLYFLKG